MACRHQGSSSMPEASLDFAMVERNRANTAPAKISITSVGAVAAGWAGSSFVRADRLVWLAFRFTNA